jgi:integrase
VPLTRTLREEVWTPTNIEQLKAGVASTASMGRSVTEYPFPWTHTGAYHHLDKLTEAAGVTCDGFHLLRHTRATRLLERGVPLRVVSTLLGHASTAVTERVYAHADALAYTHYLD